MAKKNSSKNKAGANGGKKGGKSSTPKVSTFANAPIFDILHNFQKAPDQWAARYILIISAIIIRSAVGLGSFLGMGEKPINGDFEAQRHWMEITINLPLNQWYFFDLQYWGLDYPPLTAYHLYLFGKLGSLINSTWFKLGTSRGLETIDLKNYMRFTSLISELIIFSPALLGFITFMGKKLNISRIDQIVITCVIMCQPALILIDHGHFQFNSVMLGFFLYSLVDLLKGNYILSSIWFMSAVFFKQMALYYAPFIFFFILSKLFNNYYDFNTKKLSNLITKFNFRKLVSIGLAIFVSVLVILSPFLQSGSSSEILTNLNQIMIRVFPFGRGLFEDKVGNFWCASNILIKYKQIFSNEELTKLSLLLTLVSILPPCLMIFYKNVMVSKFSKTSTNKSIYLCLVYGFAATSWGFFLFSFQVHEKTVLVPLIPSTLLYCLNDEYYISIIQWINNIATFSLYPLLKKDGLVLRYVIMICLINWLIGGFNWKNNLLFQRKSRFWNLIFILSYLAALGYHAIDAYLEPPKLYPDLWVILNITISFGCFSIFYLWLLYEIYKL